MAKIAHLILAHHNPIQLARLVNKLQHPDADIYIHLDAKTDVGTFSFILQIPQVYLIQKRITVYWGSYSIVQATINSFTEILATNKAYSHINLLSGNDYPIKSTSYIHNFFDQHADNIFMEYLTEDSEWWQSIKRRVTEYHLTDFHFPAAYWVQVLMNKVLPKRKLPQGLVLVGRSQWLTVTLAGAKYVVDYLRQHPGVQRFFRLTWGADEIAIQTILYNSPLRDKIINNNNRYIDWSGNKASPKTLTMADADQLINSPALYARKFDLAEQPDIINYLDNKFS